MSKTIKLNSDGTINDYTYILSKTNHEHLGQLKNITDAFCKSNMNSIDEVSFKIYKELDGKTEPLWNELSDLRLIYVAEIDEYFQIVTPISDTGNNICKSITATSQCEAELSQTLVSLEINSEDDIARTNYYEEFPTVFYRDIDDLDRYEDIWKSSDKFTIYKNDEKTVVDLEETLKLRRSILKGSSFMHRVLYKNPNYSIGYIDDSLKGLIRTFSVSDTALYDFLSGDVSEQYNCLFQYDSVNRTISAYDLYTVCEDCSYRGDFNDVCPKCGSTQLKYYGEDTTIFISSDNLTEEISYSTDVDSIKNTFKLEAGDDLMTAQVINCNPTGEYLIYIAPELRDDMSDELVQKLDAYSELVDENEEIYQQYVSNWEEALEQVNYLTHTMMPSVSDIENGTATVSAATEIAKITESNLSPMAVSKLETSTSAYTISSALENYVKVFVKTGYVRVSTFDTSFTYLGEQSDGFIHGTWKGKFRVSNYSAEEDVLETDELTIDIYNNYEEFINQKIVKTIAENADADHSVFDVLSIKDLQEFKDALKLYCRERLKSFHDAIYAACSALQSINQSNTEAELYEDVYKPYIDKVNACADEMDIREQKINEQQSIADDNLNKMNEIRDSLNFESFLGEELYKEFCSFRREDKYSNSNYISDGLTTSQQIENAKKFIDQAKKSIVKFGTPTHKISTTLYNLLLIPEFKPIINKFKLGNWLRIKVDDTIYRLRLISYEINFEDITTINVEFSDVTKTSDGYSDIQSILSSAASISSSISMVTKQAEKGEKANNEIINALENGLNSALITIKNNKNEEFIVNENGIMGRSFDDTTGEYSPKQIGITHNILAFTTDNWVTTSLAIGEHEYNYYNTSKGSMDVGIDYGLTAKFVQTGYIWGTSIVSGDIYSENYKYGSVGTHLDLKSGSFELAGDKIVYDSTKNKLQLKGVNIEWASSNSPEITDINGLEDELNGIQNDLEQLDGRIQTYSQTNDPSIDWNTIELKNQHSGDIWVNPNDGLTKQWDGTKWVGITDSYLNSLASSKAQIFTVKPTVAYFKGDMLIPVSDFTFNGVTYKQEKAYRALKNSNGVTFSNSDWDALDYTNDDYIINFINGDYAKTIETIKSQVDGKARAWYMSTDPSNASTNPDWNTSEDHDGDLWYNTSATSQVTSIYKNGGWQPTNVPKAVFDTIDGKRQIFVRKPDTKYMTGDLWIISTEDCSDGKITVNGITYEANSTLIAVLPDSEEERTEYTESDWHDISTHDGIVALDQSTQALNKFSDIANDSKITPTEKQSIKLLYENITAEKNSIINDCIEYEMNNSTSSYYTDYENFNKSFTSLKTLFGSILSNMETTIDVPSNYQSTINDYYTKYDIINTDIQKASKKYSENVLENFVKGDYAEALQNINTQIDGKADTFYQSTKPHEEYTNVADNITYNLYVGDLWYDTSTGKSYIYNKIANGSNFDYKWKYMKVPQEVYDKIDGVASIYVTLPSNPNIGDLLIPNTDIDGTNYKTGKVYKYNGSSWVEIAYTDDTAWKAWTSDSGEFGQYKIQIQSQIDGKSNCTYGGSTPPSNPETGDLWFCTDSSKGYSADKAYMYNGSSWKESNGVPDSVWDIADGKSSIFVVKPSKALSSIDSHYYYKGDIWILESDMTLNGKEYKAGSILTSTSDSTSFVESHWVEKVRYTDDTKADKVDESLKAYKEEILKFQEQVNNSFSTLNNAVPVTQIGSDYVISPKMAAQYLYVTKDNYSVEIDPSHSAGNNTLNGYLFAIRDKSKSDNDQVIMGVDTNGNGIFEGNIIADSGSVGKWTIGKPSDYSLNECLYTLTNFGIVGLQSSSASSNVAFFVKDTSGKDITYIKNDGTLYSQKAEISGTITTSNITATGGTITDLKIIGSLLLNKGYLTTSSSRTSYDQSEAGMTLDENGIGGYSSSTEYWNMGANGKLTAAGVTLSNAEITGKITAIEGLIGGFNISENSIQNNQVYLGEDKILFGDTNSNYCEIDNGILKAKGAKIDGSLIGTNIYIESTNANKQSSTASIKTQDYTTVNNLHYQYLELDSIYVSSSNVTYKRSLSCNAPDNGINMGCYKLSSGAWNSLSSISCHEDGSVSISGSKTYINSNLETSGKISTNSSLSVGSSLSVTGTTKVDSPIYMSYGSLHVVGEYGLYNDDIGDNGAYMVHKYSNESYGGEHTRLGNGTIPTGIIGKGNVYANHSISVVSDERVKKDFETLDKYEDWYLTLKPMSYKFKNGTSDRRHVGIIAQDIKQSLLDSNLSTLDFAGYVEMPTDPDLVEYIEDNTMCTVRYNEFIMLNTHMIQQAYKKIAELEERIKQLSN